MSATRVTGRILQFEDGLIIDYRYRSVTTGSKGIEDRLCSYTAIIAGLVTIILPGMGLKVRVVVSP